MIDDIDALEIPMIITKMELIPSSTFTHLVAEFLYAVK